MAGSGAARPTGITIMAVLSLIGGVFGLLGGLAALGFGALFASVTGVGGLFQILGIVALGIAVADLAIAYGFWTLKPWAWSLAFIFFALNIVLELLRFISWGGYGFTNIVVSLVFAGIIVYYLNQTEIRKAFGAPASGFPVVGSALDKYIPKGK